MTLPQCLIESAVYSYSFDTGLIATPKFVFYPIVIYTIVKEVTNSAIIVCINQVEGIDTIAVCKSDIMLDGIPCGILFKLFNFDPALIIVDGKTPLNRYITGVFMNLKSLTAAAKSRAFVSITLSYELEALPRAFCAAPDSCTPFCGVVTPFQLEAIVSSF